MARAGSIAGHRPVGRSVSGRTTSRRTPSLLGATGSFHVLPLPSPQMKRLSKIAALAAVAAVVLVRARRPPRAPRRSPRPRARARPQRPHRRPARRAPACLVRPKPRGAASGTHFPNGSRRPTAPGPPRPARVRRRPSSSCTAGLTAGAAADVFRTGLLVYFPTVDRDGPLEDGSFVVSVAGSCHIEVRIAPLGGRSWRGSCTERAARS